jgi:serine/threonine protein kinase
MSKALRLRLQAALGDSYILDRELSGGGMSRVFLGRDTMLGRQVVLKVLPPEAATQEPAARFRREAMLVARLQHPHILPVFGVGVVDDIQYFTMPYVEGGSLRTHLEKHRHLPVEDARRVLSEIGDALACAHRQGIVHRDVKPENIFLERRTGRTLLADFGVALALGEPEGVTQAGTTVGTPAYMSPEQVDGRPLDGLSDIYSLGLVGWEMVTGQRPWSGDSVYDVMYKQKHEPLPSLDSFNIDVEPHYVRAIERAVRKDPQERWPSAEAFVAALDPEQDREKRIYPHGLWSADMKDSAAAHSSAAHSSIEEEDAEPAMAGEDSPTIVAHQHSPFEYPQRQRAGMDSQEYEYRARVGWRSSMYGAREERSSGSSGWARAAAVAAVVLVAAAAAASATTAGRRMLMAPFSTAAVPSVTTTVAAPVAAPVAEPAASPVAGPVAAIDTPAVAVGKVPASDIAATLMTPTPSAQPAAVKTVAAAPQVQIVGRLAAAASPRVTRRTRRDYAEARPGASVQARVATAELQLHTYERVMANEPDGHASQSAPVPDHAMAAPLPAMPAASAPATTVPAPAVTPAPVVATPVAPVRATTARDTTPPAVATPVATPTVTKTPPPAPVPSMGIPAVSSRTAMPRAVTPPAAANAPAVAAPVTPSPASAPDPASGSTSNPPLAPAVPTASDAPGSATPPSGPTSSAPPPGGLSAGGRADAVRVPPSSGSAAGTKAETTACRPAFPGSHVCRVYDPNTGQVVGYQYIPGGTSAAPTP